MAEWCLWQNRMLQPMPRIHPNKQSNRHWWQHLTTVPRLHLCRLAVWHHYFSLEGKTEKKFIIMSIQNKIHELVQIICASCILLILMGPWLQEESSCSIFSVFKYNDVFILIGHTIDLVYLWCPTYIVMHLSGCLYDTLFLCKTKYRTLPLLGHARD
jgi:hypothetical protein